MFTTSMSSSNDQFGFSSLSSVPVLLWLMVFVEGFGSYSTNSVDELCNLHYCILLFLSYPYILYSYYGVSPNEIIKLL